MNDLMEYLQAGYVGLYDDGEIDEVISSIYSLISWSVRDEAHTLELNPNRAIWMKEGKELGYLPMKPAPNPTHRETLLMIIERDNVVAQHLELITETPDILIFKIKYA